MLTVLVVLLALVAMTTANSLTAYTPKANIDLSCPPCPACPDVEVGACVGGNRCEPPEAEAEEPEEE